MWKSIICVFVLLWFKPHLGIAQYDLGQQISQQVRDSLKGLDTLGARINADVQRQLQPLDHLGEDIENRVQNSLRPVYAMSIRNDMAHGIGGTTIATYHGNKPRSFIIENGIRRVCKGNIQGSQCDGTLEPFEIVNREDYCYSTSYASVNDNICLSSGSINVQVYNNNINCNSVDGSPTVILTRKEFRDLCGSISPRQIVYKYYANPNDPSAIPIPNPNPYVVCQNNEPGVCEFVVDNAEEVGSSISTRNGFSNVGNIVSNGNNVIINY